MNTGKKQHEPMSEVNQIIFDKFPMRIKYNGYLSGTDFEVKYRKSLLSWLKEGDNLEKLKAFSDTVNLQLDEVFYYSNKGDFNLLDGYWMHPGAAYLFLLWCGVNCRTAFGLTFHAEMALMESQGVYIEDNFL